MTSLEEKINTILSVIANHDSKLSVIDNLNTTITRLAADITSNQQALRVGGNSSSTVVRAGGVGRGKK